MSSNLRIGSGFDAHKFSEEALDTDIMLGGVAVSHTHAILAHSDGDVVLHALVDAILGAQAEGDIGLHFPPSDPQWKGKDSRFFVEHAVSLLHQKKGHLINADITIIAQTPKIGPHRQAMQQSIASLLHLPKNLVNIKATTTEHMGFTGRKEGIAAHAVILVEMHGHH